MVNFAAACTMLLLALITTGPAKAQRPASIHVGIMVDQTWPAVSGLLEGLRELGWIEGHNLRVDYRWTDNVIERHAEMARALLALGVNVIVTNGTAATVGAQRASSVIPIVAILGDSSVPLFARDLSRPVSNVTGLSTLSQTLHAKRLELLRDLVPKLARVAFVRNSANPNSSFAQTVLPVAANRIGVVVDFVDLKGFDFEYFSDTVAARQPDALVVANDVEILARREQVTAIAARMRIPAIYAYRAFVEAGGLVSYDTDYRELLRRAAKYVDRIVAGSKPGDLPFEQAERFSITLNLSVARELGLTISPEFAARVDEYIE